MALINDKYKHNLNNLKIAKTYKLYMGVPF